MKPKQRRARGTLRLWPNLALGVILPLGLSSSLLGFIAPNEKSPLISIQKGPKLHIQETVVRSNPSSLEKASTFSTQNFGFGSGVEFITNTATGAVEILQGELGLHLNGMKSRVGVYALISEFIDSHKEFFGFTSENLQIVNDAFYQDDALTFMKLKVKRGPYIIADSNLDFRFRNDQLIQIINQTYSQIEHESATYLGASKLMQRAKDYTFALSTDRHAPYYRYDQSLNKLILVAPFTVSTEEHDSLTLELIASNGKVFSLKNNTFYNSGHAKADVYPRWFGDDFIQAPLSFTNIGPRTQEGPLVTNQDGAFMNVPLNNIPSIIGDLNGPHVSIKRLSGNPPNVVSSKNRDLWQLYLEAKEPVHSTNDLLMAQVMIFVHTNKIVRTALKYINHPWLHAPLLANANLTSNCNAHWDGTTINFYTGNAQCGNTGLIADVIYHEWGHGLDAKTGGIEDGAFSEGYGDIMSLVFTKSPKLGIGFRLPNFEPVRDLEPDAIYPRDQGEVHSEGLIIGSTFWDLMKIYIEKFGEEEATEILRNYAFKMIFTARTYLDVYQALLVLDDDDEDLTNGTPRKCILNEVFAAHGLVTPDLSCELAGVREVQFEDEDDDGFLEPGESISVKVAAFNPHSKALEGLTGLMSVEEKDSIVLEKDSLTWDAIAAKSTGLSKDEILFTVSEEAACGAPLHFKLKLAGNHKEVLHNFDRILGRNIGVASTFIGQGLPLPILDQKSTELFIESSHDSWPENAKIFNAHLKFKITHSYVGDLVVSLQSPSGKIVELYRGRGGDDDVIFDENISQHFKNENIEGRWKFIVLDRFSRDEGTLDSLKLSLTPEMYLCD